MENQTQNQEAKQEPTLSEHDQAMVEKVDQSKAQTESSTQTDEQRMLAGKYGSVEELEKAYEHLQSKLGQPAEEEVSEEAAIEIKEGETPSTEDAQALATEKGIDYSALEKEYQESGNLSEDTYKALADQGIPQNMVDAYIAGQEALSQSVISNMQKVAGGETEYNEMIQWAQDTLSESDVEAFNASLTNENAAQFAIQGLHARFSAEKGPNLIKGGTSPVSSGGFASKQEMMVDMANPQYKRDPAFRAEVQRRVALSNFG